ncbi:PhaM family polyhydroxyalkanoate granule multifunctional regulatory protein [Undibacterium danionis]|uniref:PhaM family polyhydroxyalkanoate granule multifunctional regulatory protein n=1 Tax=Undibacterium danionis TaxID=1812100 RepID=A0ABV6IDC4_9BURK
MMQNPFQNHTAGNMGAMNDPLAFVKKLWGDMQLPGMVTPTLSIDELDKQIKDLKTVESWLTVNMNMLKGTIQALEVQRATIAALKSMGESFAQATSPDTDSTNKSAPTGFSSRWPMPETSAPKTAPRPAVPEPTLEDEMDEDDESDLGAPEEDAPVADEPILKAAAKSSAVSETEVAATQKKSDSTQDSASQSERSGFSNPAAWWTVLQDQFKQALSHAMQDEVAAKTAKDAAPSTKSSAKAVKASAKTAPRTKSKVVQATVKESSAGKSLKAKAAVKTTTVKTTSPSKSLPKSIQKTPLTSNRKPKLN